MQSTYSAFAAIRRDGTVVAWGDKHGGGDITETPTKNSAAFFLLEWLKTVEVEICDNLW